MQYDAPRREDAGGRPRQRVDGRRRRQDDHLHPARRRQVLVGQSGARRRRGLFLEARRGAQQVAGLPPDPARLDPGEYRRRWSRPTATRSSSSMPATSPRPSCSTCWPRVRPRSSTQSTVQANEASGDMGNAWLKANSAGTGPFVLKASARPRSSTSTANPDYFRGAPAMKSVIIRHVAEAGDPAAAAGVGRRRHRQEPDAGPDRRPRRQGQDQGRDLSAGRRALPVLQPEDEALQPEAVWEAAAISSTTRA